MEEHTNQSERDKLIAWHTAMANEPKRNEAKRQKHRATAAMLAADKAGVEVKRGTCNQFLQVQSSEENLTVWAIPKTRQFSWEQQDERYWIKMVPEYRCVQQAVAVSVTDDVTKDQA